MNNLMKSFILFTFLSLAQCKSYILVDNYELPVENKNKVQNTLFLGFFNYYPTPTLLPIFFEQFLCPKNAKLDTEENEQFFLPAKNTKKFSICARTPVGFPLNTSQVYFGWTDSKLHNKSIQERNVHFDSFTDIYFSEVGVIGIEEFKEIFFAKKTKENKIKDSKYNFYVIGVLSPVERELTVRGIFLKSISILPYLASFGMIPLIEENQVSPNFYIFDNEFRKVKSFTFSERSYMISTIWRMNYPDYFGYSHFAFPSNHILSFQPSILEFKKEFEKFCEINKC